MYFFDKDHLPFFVILTSYFWKQKYHLFLHDNARKIIIQCIFWRKIIFCFPSKVVKNKIISRRKVIFQCNFFGKTIFSEYLKKEKNDFSCSEQFFTLFLGINHVSYLIAEILICNSFLECYNNLFLSSITDFTLMELFITRSLQPPAFNFIKKETLTQVFSREFCEIFKNTFFAEHLRWRLLHHTSQFVVPDLANL